MSSTARPTYSRLTRAKSCASGPSWLKAFTTRMPEKFSCALVERSPNFACSRSKRTWTLRPTYQNASDATGIRIMEMTVSFTETPSIESTAKTKVMIVNEPCISAGPSI